MKTVLSLAVSKVKKPITYLSLLTVLVLSSSCEYNTLETPIDCTNSNIAVEMVSKTDANCGLSNGSVELSATGASAPFTFSLAGNTQGTGTFEALAAGNYTFTAIDANGCSSETSVSIGNVDGVSITDVETKDAGCGSNTGQITITASNGAEPYSYSIDGSNFQSSNNFSTLASGSYTTIVKDANNCEFTQAVSINSGISFSATISPIIQANCAISGCHNGSQFPNLSNYNGINSNASNIQSRTNNRSMPQGRTLTQTQINNIACWVEDGALNN